MEVLYLEDSYLKEFEATVESVKEGKFVLLDRTAFYPNSGGQPHDTGKLVRESDGKEFPVIFVCKSEGRISHQIEDGESLKDGDKVKGIIDWDRRYRFMRSHTACHIVSAIFHNETLCLITGNQIELEKCRIDFSLDDYSPENIKGYIDKANEAIRRNLEVTFKNMLREEALKIPSMVKLAGALPPAISELRIVSIGDVDTQADGGTHVKNTSEVGELEFLKAENKGKNNRRVYFKIR